MTLTYQSIDSATTEWLDAGSSTAASATLYGGKAYPPPPPPPSDDETYYGTNGDDRLEGGAGNDRLFGSKGEDTAVYRGALEDYELSYDRELGYYRILDKVSGRDGSDEVGFEVERLEFNGLAVLLDGEGGARLADGTVLLAPVGPPENKIVTGFDPIGGDWQPGIPYDGNMGEAIDYIVAWDGELASIDFLGVAFASPYVALVDA